MNATMEFDKEKVEYLKSLSNTYKTSVYDLIKSFSYNEEDYQLNINEYNRVNSEI